MKRLIVSNLMLLAVVVGCGGPSASYDATVEGSVTVDGQLAKQGQVVFHPATKGPTAYGNIFDNGSYSLRVGQGDLKDVDGGNLKSGEYVVTVVVNSPSIADETVGDGGPPRPGPRLTAAKYASQATSNLRVQVKPGRNVVPLELEGAAADPPEKTETDASVVSTDGEAAADDADQPQNQPDSTADSKPAPHTPAEEAQP
jgi:hypothetical protein